MCRPIDNGTESEISHLATRVYNLCSALATGRLWTTGVQNGLPIYSRPDAERAWGKLMTLYKMALAYSARAVPE
jgi:hypothetical protein